MATLSKQEGLQALLFEFDNASKHSLKSMKILVTMESEDMPDTQPVEDSGNETSFFTQNSEPVKYWGRLYPLVNGFRPLGRLEFRFCGVYCNFKKYTGI